MGGHTDLKFPLASGLFKNCQLQYKHTLLKKKESGEFFLGYRNSNLLTLTLVTKVVKAKQQYVKESCYDSWMSEQS